MKYFIAKFSDDHDRKGFMIIGSDYPLDTVKRNIEGAFACLFINPVMIGKFESMVYFDSISEISENDAIAINSHIGTVYGIASAIEDDLIDWLM